MKTIDGVRMYDSGELATLFNISKTTLSKMRGAGRIVSVRIGPRLYTSEECVRNFLNGLTGPADKKQVTQ